ncbi:hypothetical protein ICR46_003340 [Vibrio cholerae]|nr:hypothetical protein [Vibrio cholerae]
MYKLGIFIFLLVFPGGILGSIFYMFDYPILSYGSNLRGFGYVLGAVLSVFFIKKIIIKVNKDIGGFYVFIFLPICTFIVFLLQAIYHVDIYGAVASNAIKTTFEFNWPIFFSYLSMFFLGFYLVDSLIKYKNLVVISWFFCVLILLVNVDYNLLSIDFNSTIDSSNKAFTLTVSDSFAIVSLVVISFFYKNKIVFILIFTSLVCLFFLSSRTAFLVFFFTLLILIFKRNNYLSIFVTLAFLLFSFALMMSFLESNATGYTARLFSLSLDDSSVIGRVNMFSSGLAGLSSNYLVGDFAGQLRQSLDDSGVRWGGYIHNALSFLRQFGMLGFLSIICLFLCSIFIIIFGKVDDKDKMISISIISYIVIVYILSRSYVYPWIFLLPGLCNSFFNRRINDFVK